VFSQTTPEDALQVEGLLEGLPEDSDLQLAVVQGDCNQDIEQYLGKGIKILLFRMKFEFNIKFHREIFKLST